MRVKYILDMNEDSPFDKYCLDNGHDLYFALADVKEWIRSKRKYTDETSVDLEELWDMFWDVLGGRGITLDY